MSRKKAIWNRCPQDDCKETVLWMPFEERCGKCGYGNITTHASAPDATSTSIKASHKTSFDWVTVALIGSGFLISFVLGRISVILDLL